MSRSWGGLPPEGSADYLRLKEHVGTKYRPYSEDAQRQQELAYQQAFGAAALHDGGPNPWQISTADPLLQQLMAELAEQQDTVEYEGSDGDVDADEDWESASEDFDDDQLRFLEALQALDPQLPSKGKNAELRRILGMTRKAVSQMALRCGVSLAKVGRCTRLPLPDMEEVKRVLGARLATMKGLAASLGESSRTLQRQMSTGGLGTRHDCRLATDAQLAATILLLQEDVGFRNLGVTYTQSTLPFGSRCWFHSFVVDVNTAPPPPTISRPFSGRLLPYGNFPRRQIARVLRLLDPAASAARKKGKLRRRLYFVSRTLYVALINQYLELFIIL